MRAETTRLYPVGRGSALERHARCRGGMHESQSRGVQAQSPERVPPAAMRGIAHDGMTELRELDANLVTSASAERQVEHGRVAAARADAVMRDGHPSLVADAHAQAAVLHEPAFEPAGIVPHAAFDDGHVPALDRPGLELRLQETLRALGL